MALLARAQAGGVAPGGVLAAVTWNGVFGVGAGHTNRQTMSGITGSHSISVSATGAGVVLVNKSGTITPYAGPFNVASGATLAWLVVNPGSSVVSGTVTVTDATTSTVIGTFTYVVNPP